MMVMLSVYGCIYVLFLLAVHSALRTRNHVIGWRYMYADLG
jgi:hypothetical protein